MDSNSRGMKKFNDCLESCGMTDLGIIGAIYTWTNNQELPVLSRIDRVLLNEKLGNLWQAATVVGLIRTTSDHLPLLFSSDVSQRRKSPFRVFLSWFHLPEFPNLLQSWWEAEHHVGYSSFVMWRKLKGLKQNILEWRKLKESHWGGKIKKIETEIMQLDELESSGDWSVERKIQRSICKQELDNLLLRVEEDRKQRARVDWVKVGDRNTSFFQNFVKARKKSNSISKLMIQGDLRIKI